jgi:hypothetical protein
MAKVDVSVVTGLQDERQRERGSIVSRGKEFVKTMSGIN